LILVFLLRLWKAQLRFLQYKLPHVIEVVIKIKVHDVRLLRALEVPLFRDEKLVYFLRARGIDRSLILGAVEEGALEPFEALGLLTGLCLID